MMAPALGSKVLAHAQSSSTALPPGAVRVAIILVNWNAWREAVECLSSVFASDAPVMADVFLVDNASTDDSVERIVEWCADPVPPAEYPAFSGVRHVERRPIPCRVLQADRRPAPAADCSCLTVLRSDTNLGFAAGNNIGMIAAGVTGYSHFWLLNTDTVVRHDALAESLARSSADPRIGMVGSTLMEYYRPDQVQTMGGGWLDRETTCIRHIGEGMAATELPDDGSAVEARMAYVVGASMLVTREFIVNVGLMQEDYFLYYEEIDWAMRAGPSFRLGYAPRSIVFHKMGGSSSQVASTFSMNLLYRNRLRFVSRFLPDRLGATKRVLAVELVRHVLKRRWVAARLVARALRDSGRLADSAPTARVER